MKQIFYGKVKDGTVKLASKSEFQAAVTALEGSEVEITISKKKKQRSLQQNAYYFGVIIPMLRQGLIDTGLRVSKSETHEMLKSKFLKKEIINEKTGEIFEYIGSTTEMSTVDFMGFIAEIQMWASTYLSLYLPDPGEQLQADFYSDEKG